MSSFSELTSLLWWLMLLSSVAIILNDIGAAILPRTSKQAAPTGTRSSTTSEDELAALTKKIRRGLQRPANFRSLKREMAHTMLRAGFASRNLPLPRSPETQPELVREAIKDPELIRFIEESLQVSASKRVYLPRTQLLREFERTVEMLEKAERELR